MATAERKTTAHFSIDGEWFTGLCRDWVVEGRWDHAMKALVNDIPGFGHDRAVQLLRGEMKLTGVDDLDFVEDTDSADYRAQLDRMFGGVFVDQWGTYLRPYAVVTSWCSKDMMIDDGFDRSTPVLTRGSEISKMRRGKHSRNPLVYADDYRTDVARQVTIRTGQLSEQRGLPLRNDETVLCRVVDNFPHLIVKSFGLNKISEAIQYLYDKGIMLEETGAHVAFPDLGKEEAMMAEAVKTQPVDLDEASLDAARKRFLNDPAKRDTLLQTIHKTGTQTVDALREIILAQAGDDFFDLTYTVKGEERTVRVPTAPFENWALWRTSGADLAKPWQKVSPSGMKMGGDDPYHTDWMIGAGLALDSFYEDGSNLNDVAFARNFAMQESLCTFKAAILCGEGDVFGEVVHPKANEEVDADKIAVIPTANARYLAAAMTAKAVIVEQGGAMAHLVTVGREKGVLIMRVEGAREKYPAGCKVTMKSRQGEVTMARTPVRDAFGEFGDI